ncbi:MAG: oligosaccharide flippase family protein, partial [Bdellovibrionota bacterium]
MKHTISKLISKERLKLFITGKTMSFGVGYVAFLGGRLLRDLLLARILGAGSFGAWAALNILRQYGNYSDAGLMNGLARELPKIKDDKAQASELSGLAVFGTIIGTAFVLLWVLLIKPEGFKTDDISWIALSLMILFICFEKSYKYFNALLLGFDQVKAAGLWLACLSILDLILAITGAYFWGVEGLLSGTVLAIFITAVAMNYNKPVSIKFKYSFVTLKNLLLSSILLMCFGLLNIALHNFDRTVFLFLNGPDEILGSYHAASLFALAVSIIPFILCTVVNPYIYSLKSDSDSEFIKIVNSTGLISCIVASAGALLAFSISPY